MICPMCKGTYIQKRGFRTWKDKKVQEYRCMNCKHIFTLFRRRLSEIPIELKEKVLELSHTMKPFINKYDQLKKVTYSTRDIAKLQGLGHSTIARIIKEMD